MTQRQRVPAGFYILRNVSTGTVLDLWGGSAAENTPVIGYALHGGDNQKWQLEWAGSEPIMTLRNVKSGTYLSCKDVRPGGKVTGSATPQRWSVTAASSGYALELANHGYVLDVTASNPENETPIIIYPNYATDNQKWTFLTLSEPVAQVTIQRSLSSVPPHQPPGEGVASPRPARTNPQKGSGHILAGYQHEIVNKYSFQWSWVEPRSGIPIPLTFNVNTDFGVPSFKSIGAPDEDGLQVDYDRALGQPHGFCSFSGTIGRGRLYIEIPAWTIEISGEIEGGPVVGSRFSGNGGWYS
ncbi:hypothetical protein RSOLAG22IIIB_08608 [Rhizoctonia solani]|uniref:Ricin B lectin domain-containing protein n=1 Tax=Rhizoctonia solani TaxID=456999 RepID=A0A0K6FTS8_9AGAM|nr:hypothetical protein RSOLAG22IIIB_08608 [Rhizoctonia solani]